MPAKKHPAKTRTKPTKTAAPVNGSLRSDEAHFRTVFDNTDTAYLLLDRKYNLVSFNKFAKTLFLHQFGVVLQNGDRLADYIPEHKRKDSEAQYKKVLKGEHVSLEKSFPAAKGRVVWYNFKYSPVTDDAGKTIGTVLAASDISKKKNAEIEKEKLDEALRASHLGLKKLVAKSQAAREEERLHVAREVHDELGQLLTTTKIEVSMLRKKLSALGENPAVQQEFGHIIGLIDKSIQSVKKIATDLRPEMLDELGLVESIKWQAEEFTKNTGVECTLSISKDFTDLSNDINRSTTLYRIVQEALTNVARHAKASKVKIAIKTSIDNIFLVVQDNGIGITERQKNKKNSFGLIGIRERVLMLNGIIDFAGQPKGGTVVYVQIPYFI